VGLVLDSSAAVAAERQGKYARQLLEDIVFQTGDDEIAISVVTLLELAHGISRADTPDEIMTVLPVQPVTAPVALRAGKIDGQYQAQGVRIPLSDLLIGVTALELGYRVGTANVRHFRLIPGLSVVEL